MAKTATKVKSNDKSSQSETKQAETKPTGLSGLDHSKLQRTKPPDDRRSKKEPLPVSLGPIDKIVDFGFNPSREKMPEVTVVDRNQARLLPQLSLVDLMWNYSIEISSFRQDAEQYKEVYEKDTPAPPDLIDEFIYRTAQWQKSVEGQNLKSLVDLGLAEIETRQSEGEESFRGSGFPDD